MEGGEKCITQKPPHSQRSSMPDIATGGRTEEEAMRLPPTPGEDSELHRGAWASDL